MYHIIFESFPANTLSNDATIIKATFKWDDPFLFNDQLADKERMIRNPARRYCQDKLMPHINSKSASGKCHKWTPNMPMSMVLPTWMMSARVST